MPMYRYQCESCGHAYRALLANGSSTPPVCPACGAETVRRLLPRVSVAYKGSGYYNTDYRSKRSSGGDSATRENATSDSTTAESSSSED